MTKNKLKYLYSNSYLESWLKQAGFSIANHIHIFVIMFLLLYLFLIIYSFLN